MTAHQTIEAEVDIISGAEMVVRALIDQGVDVLFGYPGGAVLPIYDALFNEPRLKHVLVRHEQGATHAAEGYARSTGKPGVVLVTSGPGATNAVTGIVDALMDSIPMVVITGQVATHLIGTDAFQECDTIGITRPCTKHNYLVKSVEDLPRIIHEAFHIATSGRPGPVVIDIPKDVQFGKAAYHGPAEVTHAHNYAPRTKAEPSKIAEAVAMIARARKPILYTGGGVINAGPKAARLLREFAELTGAPVTSTLMGLGAFPASDPKWLGMVGMHGSFESNNAMHDCDVMVAIGARFDDRVTGRLDAFAPTSQKIHIDIDPSSIGKNVRADVGLVGDAASVLEDMIAAWKARNLATDKAAMKSWWAEIEGWRARNSFGFRPDAKLIKPQHAIQRLYELTKDRDTYITTEVGQHQMWAAQFYRFEEPNRWMTSGGLGTMGYGLPAAVGVQMAHPDALVIDIGGDASVQMTMQEISTAVQYDLPIKIFILNNEWMGMVRQWQQLLHGERYSHSYSSSLPDFVKLAEAYGGVGLRAEHPDELDDKILEMINVRKPVIFDCRVTKEENCFPMIPSGKAHNEMIMAEEARDLGSIIDDAGKRLV
ncbi:acetolactate synthase 3 large subunit [Phenylobacterium sp. J426]|uniref:acetolactate synthase 3 large subunit n=1 Tax=Phenylobacterium sp. J426 TaxID=2898439 RepID=UPI00215150ED|nr:acetolactate synthase 3 large subunit [Phenylobacterium sp. J426]MCR5874854.1 acetolactate synthase 3 large subunit [Phenylobacterium sp. J426]